VTARLWPVRVGEDEDPLAGLFALFADDGELAWQERALCAEVGPGGDWWFPEKGGSTREAKRVCWSCEVRAECLSYALETGQGFGIWGGLSERERRRFKRQREAQAA
jgi:WhiB family transcriptional regulator, redox-sensing transcriptional regulator